MVKSVGGLLTVCVSAAEVLPANVASPKYLAVMECEPAARAEMETEACFALSVVVPMTFAPSKNWTVPVGVPVAVTVAVKVTDCPVVDGFAEEATDILVVWPVPLTVCVTRRKCCRQTWRRPGIWP